MAEDFASCEGKMNAARDIVAAYLKSVGKDGGSAPMSREEVCAFYKQVYKTVDETVPGRQERSIGLGV